MKYIIFLFLALIFLSCENPLEGFVLGFKEPLEEATVRIQFNLPEDGKLPKDLVFKVIGQDADKIVTNLNSKKLNVSREGVIVLALSPEVLASADKPIRFSIEARAEGYLKIVKEFKFIGKGNQTFNARLVKSGLNGTLSTIQMPLENGLHVLGGGAEKLFLETNENLVYKDASGMEVSGEKELIMMRYNYQIARSNLPTGGVASNPVDKENKPLENSFDFYQVASMALIELSSVNGDVVKSISSGFKLTMQLSKSTINPETSMPIKAGDMLSIVSYDTDSGVWRLEEEAVIKVDKENLLYVECQVNHLSYWIAGWTRNLCKNGPNFKIQSVYNGIDVSYLARLVGTTSGKTIREYYISVNNGATLGIRNMPEEQELVRLEVYDFNNYHGGDNKSPIAISESRDICSQGESLISLEKVSIPAYVEIEMFTNCAAGKELDKNTLPAQMRIQYSEVGKNQWREAGTVRREQHIARTYRLAMGKRYDIRASSDGGVTWPFYQNNQLINKTKWLIDVKIFGGKCN